MLKQIEAGVLNIAYREEGDRAGKPVVLLHGFPYDIHAYDEVSIPLVAAGCRVITPYLRGYGPTRFVSDDVPRSGQQAAIAADLLALMDALSIDEAVLGGYDWGGRGACIVAALYPQRVRGLVSTGGYSIQDIAGSVNPVDPLEEFSFWYQYYFHSERGRRGLEQNRFDLCRLLWRLWSPHWDFDDETYRQTARSFENPDFVDVVVHSYRHRYGLVEGDPRYQSMEDALARRPKITVPVVVLDADGDGVMRVRDRHHHGRYLSHIADYRVLSRIGHNLPQEAPGDFAGAILSLL